MKNIIILNRISDKFTNLLTDAIINEPNLNVESVRKLINPILREWAIANAKGTKTKHASIERLQATISLRGFRERYWHNRFKDLVSDEVLQLHYRILQTALDKEGLK